VWTTGATDTAFLAFLFCAVFLAVRWRLVGEAAAGALAGVALVLGFVIVPTFAEMPAAAHPFSAALRLLGVGSLVWTAIFAVTCTEVRSDLRPAAVAAAGLLIPLALASPIAFSPARIIVTSQPGGVGVAEALEALACALGAVVALREAVRRRRILHWATAAALFAVAAASGITASGVTATSRAWSILPSLLLVAAATVLLTTVVGKVNTALSAVVDVDLRGRRRWEAAESQLALLRRVQLGQEHDIISTLGAVDGALLVLQHQRDRLSPERVDQLTSAAREQINWLRTLLLGGDGSTASYNVSELLSAVVSLRSAGPQAVSCDVSPDLHIIGRPDRLALVVNNLLANAAAYAPSAQVAVRARSDDNPDGTGIEVVVADDGPGMGDIDRRRAFEPGWRGAQSEKAPGNGLGLSQCRDMVEAEGGRIKLSLTDPAAAPGGQGLSVHLWLPAAGETTADPAWSMA
jgi:signal transduction histidine kinase